jgi:pyridoxal phosphate enzyme (YggS family)
MTDARTDELATNLASVRGRLAAACAVAGRDPATVTLVAVTKLQPAEDVDRLAALGVADLAESRAQELAAKAATRPGLRWHFVGRLQRNKAAQVGRYASVVHSLDAEGLAARIARGAAEAGRELPAVLVQVSLDGDPGRGGTPVAQVLPLADEAAAAGLAVRGVMAVPPLGTEPAEAFARLREVSGLLRQAHPDASWISAGMSGDLEAAVSQGSTLVRVGTALLGRRGPARG